MTSNRLHPGSDERESGTHGSGTRHGRKHRAEYVFAPALLAKYGLSAEAPLAMKLRARLMERLRAYVEAECPTQAYAAEAFAVSQPRVSDLARGKLGRVSLEALLAMCERAEITVIFYVRPAPNA